MSKGRRKRQAGGIVFRKGEDSSPLVLVVTAAGNRKRWVLPKGYVRRLEKAPAAALREVREEAGVEGRLIGPSSTVEVTTSNGQVELQYFLVQHIRDVKQKEDRDVRWLAVEDAIHLLTFASARKALLDANPEIVRLARRS